MKQYNLDDQGVLSIMYHRFEENKYPSTNIRMNVFLEHIDAIKNNGFEFYDPKLFNEKFNEPKDNKKILLTIDDAFLSFYENAWPILKKNEIPFILFVSTEPIGKRGYMTWEQIKEIEKEKFAFIGNHSHTHEYLIKFSFADFKNDINESIEIFNENLGYNPIFFSYPFGEYSLEQKNFIKKNFEYVGEKFSYEARSIHYGDKKNKKGIYGNASSKDISELKEEGIETMQIPWINDKEN